MKRRISLYIAEQLCDLDDDALVLLNVQREDLNNPAIMLNSYSQAVTLPGTAVNDIIFGHYFRADHSVAGSYNPLVRVPFSIFNETGEILASGYCKLLRVTMDGSIHTYEVQLYGSFGEFIYGLAYDADGNKKTLASLDYLGGGDTELDFVIDKTAVQNAWARLGGDTTKPKMWDVINFAPCYNGIPDGEFDPGKALAVPADVGLTAPVGAYDVSSGGYTLINLPDGVDEWAAHDLRSYLQRPVLSVKAMLEAIAKPANNGGWTLDLSDIDTTAEWPYLNTWLTRPLLPSLGTYKQTTGSITATPSASATSGPDLVSIALANVPAGTDVTLRATFGLQVNLSSAPGQGTMYTGKEVLPLTEYRDVWFLQAVGYASDNSVVAASPVTIFGPDLSHVSDLAKFADDCTFVPTLPTGQTAEYVAHTGFDAKSFTGSGTAFSSRGDFSLEVKGKNMASAKVIVKRGRIYWKPLLGKVDSVQNLATLYTSEDNSGTGYGESTSLATGVVVSATTQSSSTLRSGAKVTKQMLLSTEGTPADYLLAICKSFGLYILADGASKTARIVRRNTLFQNETIDLTDRVDTSQEVELEPIAFDAKWYDWKHENVGGAFVNEYKATEGRDYGAQRVNTGYDFDASVKNVLEGVVLKGAAAVRDAGRYWKEVEHPEEVTPFSDDINCFTAGGNNFVDSDDRYAGQVLPCSPGEAVKAYAKLADTNLTFAISFWSQQPTPGTITKQTASGTSSGGYPQVNFSASQFVVPNGKWFYFDTGFSELYIIWNDYTYLRIYNKTWTLMSYPAGKTPLYYRVMASPAGTVVNATMYVSDGPQASPDGFISGVHATAQTVGSLAEYEAVAPAGTQYVVFSSLIDAGAGYVSKKAFHVPPLFLDNGVTYGLWDSDGGNLDTAISIPVNDMVITEYAGGYDKSERAEFRDADGKPVNGADVLLLAENFLGIPVFDSFDDFRLTDDVADMDTIVGKPCWMVGSALSPLSVPHFSRYVIQTTFPDPLLPGVNTIIKSLDFGIPAEVDIPDLTYDGNTIYEQAWKKYIADRLDMDTKVLRCRVRLDGLQVGQELLRKFYWYRGALWTLNKISNYSLTTFDLAECEFVQVQDTDAYLNG